MSKELQTSIQAHRRVTYDHRYFVVHDDLFVLIKEPVVNAVLRESSIASCYHDYIVQEITGGDKCTIAGHATFAILVMINAVDSLPMLMATDTHRGPLDARLPIMSKSELCSIFENEAFAHDFYDIQWEFFTPRFMRGSFHLVLDEHVILPIVKQDAVGDTGFSQIFKTSIAIEENGKTSVCVTL